MQTNNRPATRVVMIGDFPRDVDSIGGGVESVMVYLCERLATRPEIDLHVVTLDRWGMGSRVVQNAGYTASYVAQSGMRGPIKGRQNEARLLEKVNELKPDLVHAQIAGQYAVAAYSSGRPFILTLHGVRYLEANLRTRLLDRLYRNRVVAREERKSIRNARNIISINPFIDECFSGLLKGQVKHIENPVADKWFDIEDGGRESGILYAGRITPRKDILTLLEAFRIVQAECPEAKLRIAGAADNPDPTRYFDKMKSYVSAHGLTESVRFLGNLSESALLAEYANNAVFVLAAVLETAPMSIAQAQAAGRLVVATDAGGCRHMISSGESGVIVPIGDHEALAKALIERIKDQPGSMLMRRKTREDAFARYRADVIARKTADFYREVLAAS